MSSHLRRAGRLFGHLIFWGWNGLFLLVLALGFGPAVLVDLVRAASIGVVPVPFAVFSGVLVALPVAGLGLGLWKLRRDPGRLLSLFYGVQAPLMVLCLVRIFGIQQLTASTTLALGAGFVATAALLATLLRPFREVRPSLQAARLVGQTTYLVIGLWLGGLVLVYAPPLGLDIASSLLDPWRWGSHGIASLHHLALAVAGIALMGVTAAALALFPAAMLGISLRAFLVVARASWRLLGPTRTSLISAATVFGLLGGFETSRDDSHLVAFELLEQATDEAGRDRALARSEEIRQGLLEAWLADHRYFTSDPEGDHVARLYRDHVGETLARGPQVLWQVLTGPFTYQPRVDVWRDQADAEAAYAAFFDAPLQRAERDVLVEAQRQTWSWRSAAATLLDLGAQRVWLERQEVSLTSHGDHATVWVHDVYRNRHHDDQEVLLSFSLPETAAVTGLWLGETPDRDEAFAYVVAPPGAAPEG